MMSEREDDRFEDRDERDQLPVFNTLEFQESTSVLMNRAFRYDLLGLLQEFRDLSPSMAAFRQSLKCPSRAAKPGGR